MRKLKSMMVSSALICGMVLVVGCAKQELNFDGFDSLIGYWTNPMYEDNTEGKSIINYERSNALLDDFGGIRFLEDGTLIERKNAGWCGTPPIAYADYSGKWQILNDDEIKINVAYWGGVEHRIIKIINITESTLKIEIRLMETQ